MSSCRCLNSSVLWQWSTLDKGLAPYSTPLATLILDRCLRRALGSLHKRSTDYMFNKSSEWNFISEQCNLCSAKSPWRRRRSTEANNLNKCEYRRPNDKWFWLWVANSASIMINYYSKMVKFNWRSESRVDDFQNWPHLIWTSVFRD